MSHNRDSSPVYYREIQKNAYLKHIPDDVTSSKSLGLRPLGLKKAPPKPLWTQLCVHNGRTPYLEQYRDPTAARAHRPVWRACLLTARHVTASVTARDNEYDFLVDTHEGSVRMLAPDWESMQDWVACLRSRLHELKVLPPCENVYCAAPAAAAAAAAPAPRAAARDPTSPLPPAPLPPDRIPGIDLTPLIRNTVTRASDTTTEERESPSSPMNSAASISTSTSNTLSASYSTTAALSTTTAASNISTSAANVPTSGPNPGTSSHTSVLKASPTVSNSSSTPNTLTPETIDISSWEAAETSEPFTSLPSTSQVSKGVTKICGQNICLDNSIFKRTCESDDDDFLSDLSSVGSKTGSLGSKSSRVGQEGSTGCKEGGVGSVTGSEVNNYKQTVVVSGKRADALENGMSDRPTNITVIQVSNKEPPHTAIPVIGSETDVFDFNFKSAPRNPNFVNIVNTEVNVQNSNEYGTVFSKNEPEYGHLSLTTTVSLTGDVKMTDVRSDSEGIYERLCLASTSNEICASPLSIRRLRSQEKVRKSSLPNLDSINSDSTYEYLFLSQNNSSINEIPHNITSSTSNVTTTTNVTPTHRNRSNVTTALSNVTTNVTTTAPNVTTISTTNTSNVVLNSEISNPRVHINSVSIGDSNLRGLRSNVERTPTQNTYDLSPRREARIEQNNDVKRDGRVEKIESVQPKPIWKRGLTELSLLTRLRGMAHGKRHESPDRQHDRTAAPSPVKLVHVSRPEARSDRSRRRSSSLSNGQSPPSTPGPLLQTLRARQAATLRSEQRRGAALVAAVRCSEPPVFADYNNQVWIAWWGAGGARVAGRAGDRVRGVRGAEPRDAAHARALLARPARAHAVDILFHRVPLGKIYVINKRDQESTGIKLDSECNITSVESDSPAAAAGIPPLGKWAVTEVNNRPINLVKVGEEDMNRLSLRGTEASVLIQPSALVKKLRAALKGNKTLLGLR